MNRNKINAFTLVELMIGMVVSLLLIAAATTVYLSSKQTNGLNQSLVTIQNEGQLALRVLKNSVRQAGWAEPDSFSYTLASPIRSDLSLDGGDSGSDTLAIQFEGSTDCNGPSSSDPIVEVYKLENNNLLCNDLVIVENIDSFQVLYGVRTGAGLKYITATNIVDPSLVETIQFGFVISSNQSVSSGKASQKIKLLDASLQTFTDKKARQTYTATVAVLNRPQQFTLEN